MASSSLLLFIFMIVSVYKAQLPRCEPSSRLNIMVIDRGDCCTTMTKKIGQAQGLEEDNGYAGNYQTNVTIKRSQHNFYLTLYC